MNPSEKEGGEHVAPKIPSPRPMPRKKGGAFKFILLILSYVIVAAIVWKVADQWKADPTKQQARAEQEIKSTVAKVGKLMLLPDPSVELPQVAVINDAAGLAKTQAFFVDVKDGDQVLIYLKTRKAIIYRASENKIINVGPVIADNSAASKPAAPAPAPAKATSTDTSSADKASKSTSDSETSDSR